MHFRFRNIDVDCFCFASVTLPEKLSISLSADTIFQANNCNDEDDVSVSVLFEYDGASSSLNVQAQILEQEKLTVAEKLVAKKSRRREKYAEVSQYFYIESEGHIQARIVKNMAKSAVTATESFKLRASERVELKNPRKLSDSKQAKSLKLESGVKEKPPPSPMLSRRAMSNRSGRAGRALTKQTAVDEESECSTASTDHSAVPRPRFIPRFKTPPRRPGPEVAHPEVAVVQRASFLRSKTPIARSESTVGHGRGWPTEHSVIDPAIRVSLRRTVGLRRTQSVPLPPPPNPVSVNLRPVIPGSGTKHRPRPQPSEEKFVPRWRKKVGVACTSNSAISFPVKIKNNLV